MLIADPFATHQPAVLAGTFAFVGGGQTAPKRNLTQELEQTLKGYQNTAGGFLDLSQQYQPAYARLGLDTLTTQQQGYTDAAGVYHPGTTQLGQEAASSNRAANVNDLYNFGPSGAGNILASNPFLTNALFSGMDATNRAGAGSPILSLLNSQATSQLAQNGALSPSQRLAADESTLGLFTNSGNATGNSAIAGQLLSRDAFTRQRQQEAQTLGGQVQGLNQAQNQLYGNLANAGAASATSGLTNPLFQMLGFGNLNPGNSGSLDATGSSVANANSLFPSQSGYLSDLYSSNQNASAFNNQNSANNNAALIGAGLQLFGSLFG